MGCGMTGDLRSAGALLGKLEGAGGGLRMSRLRNECGMALGPEQDRDGGGYYREGAPGLKVSINLYPSPCPIP